MSSNKKPQATSQEKRQSWSRKPQPSAKHGVAGALEKMRELKLLAKSNPLLVVPQPPLGGDWEREAAALLVDDLDTEEFVLGLQMSQKKGDVWVPTWWESKEDFLTAFVREWNDYQTRYGPALKPLDVQLQVMEVLTYMYQEAQ